MASHDARSLPRLSSGAVDKRLGPTAAPKTVTNMSSATRLAMATATLAPNPKPPKCDPMHCSIADEAETVYNQLTKGVEARTMCDSMTLMDQEERDLNSRSHVDHLIN